MKKIIFLFLLIISITGYAQNGRTSFGQPNFPIIPISLVPDTIGFKPFVIDSTGNLWRVYWNAFGSGGVDGSVTLTHNVRGDTIQVNGVNAVHDNDNPFNNPGYHFNNDKNLLAAFAKMLDTTGSGPVVQVGFAFLGNSLCQHLNLMPQHYVALLDSKFKSAGPGFVSANVVHYGMTNSLTWPTKSSFTSPLGKGLDGISAVSSAVGQTITLAVGGGSTGFDYNQWTDYTVMYYAVSGGGTFSESVDGVVIDTINTATGSGLLTHSLHGLSLQSHTLVFKSVTEGTAHNEITGFFLWQANTSGWLLDMFGESSATMTSFTQLDSTTYVKQLAVVAPSVIFIENSVNDIIANEDTTLFISKADTILRRISSVLPHTDRGLFGPANYGNVTWGTPTYPLSSYTNQIYRLCLDSNLIFWNPIHLFGSFAQAASSLMISADSLHPTQQGSELQSAEILSMLGVLTYQPPPFIPSFYSADGKFSGIIGVARDVNVNNNNIYWDSVKITRFLGGTGLPTLSLDLTNPLQVTWTGAVKNAFNQSLITSGILQSGNTSGTNFLAGVTDVGQLAGTGDFNITSSVNAFSSEYIRATTTASYADLILTNAGTSNTQLIGVGSTALGGLYTANTSSLSALVGNLFLSTNTSNPMIFATGGSATTNEAMRISSGKNLLVGTTTDNAGFIQIGSNSTTNAQMFLNGSAADVTSPTNGMLWYNSTAHTLNFRDNGATINLLGAGSSVTGSGTTNFVPVWTVASVLGNSNIKDSATFVGIGTFPNSSYQLFVGVGNTALSCYNGTNSYGYLATNQVSGDLHFGFHRSASSGADYFDLEGGNYISSNAATAELRIFSNSAGAYFPTFYSNGAEAMRISTGDNLLVGLTTDGSNGRVQITGASGKVLALNGLVGPPSTFSMVVHSTASDSGTFQIPYPTILSAIANGTALTNSTSAASIMGTTVGVGQITANTSHVGTTITEYGSFVISTAASPGTLLISGGYGAGVTFTPPALLSAQAGTVLVNEVITVLGSSGTIAWTITVNISGTTPFLAIASGTTAFNTTANASLGNALSAQWGTASTSNSIQGLIPTYVLQQ